MLVPTEEVAPTVAEPSPGENIATKPLKKRSASKNSLRISSVLQDEEKNDSSDPETPESTDHLPADDFSQEKLEQFWQQYLQQLREKDLHTYTAIHRYKINRLDDHQIELVYGSVISKTEFEVYVPDFLAQLKRHLNNFHLRLQWKLEVQTTKIEVETKRTIFEKLAQQNPALRTLDELFQLDFNT